MPSIGNDQLIRDQVLSSELKSEDPSITCSRLHRGYSPEKAIRRDFLRRLLYMSILNHATCFKMIFLLCLSRMQPARTSNNAILENTVQAAASTLLPRLCHIQTREGRVPHPLPRRPRPPLSEHRQRQPLPLLRAH